MKSITSMELAKIGVEVKKAGDEKVVIIPCCQLPHFEYSNPLHFVAHNDHRVVMSLAPLALRIGSVRFDQPQAVEKSYPQFWLDTAFLPIELK